MDTRKWQMGAGMTPSQTPSRPPSPPLGHPILQMLSDREMLPTIEQQYTLTCLWHRQPKPPSSTSAVASQPFAALRSPSQTAHQPPRTLATHSLAPTCHTRPSRRITSIQADHIPYPPASVSRYHPAASGDPPRRRREVYKLPRCRANSLPPSVVPRCRSPFHVPQE